MMLTLAPGVRTGTYEFVVTASAVTPANCNVGAQGCTRLSHQEYAWVTVVGGGATFSVSASPFTQSIQPGGTAQYTVQVTGGATGNVTLTGANSVGTVLVNGLSSAAVPIGGSATVTVTVPVGASTGASAVNIIGSLGTAQQRATPKLVIGGGGDPGYTIIQRVDGDTEDSYYRMIAAFRIR